MNITVFKQNVPFWPSISYIQPVLLKAILAAFPKAKIVDLLDKNLKPSLEDDLWIFLPGSVQIPTLQWLSKNSNNPMSRPRSLFFLNAEAAKLCIQLFHFRHLFREDDVWSVTCAAEKKLIDRWFPGNSNTVLNYYPVDTATFFPTKKSFRKKFGLPEDKQLILYSGRLSLQKNISFVLDFILRFPKLHLVLCGDIDSLGVPHIAGAPVSHVATTLIEKITALGVNHRITFIPFQDQKSLAQVMQSCDYQISLSAHYGEDFGYSIAQGLCCGLKTIVTNWGGHLNWAGSELKDSVRFVPLNWHRKQIGEPVIEPGFKLPKKSPNRFSVNYNKSIREQLKHLIVTKRKLKTHSGLKVASELSSFWQKIKQKPRPYLFESSNDRLFKTVINTYGAKKK